MRDNEFLVQGVRKSFRADTLSLRMSFPSQMVQLDKVTCPLFSAVWGLLTKEHASLTAQPLEDTVRP